MLQPFFLNRRSFRMCTVSCLSKSYPRSDDMKKLKQWRFPATERIVFFSLSCNFMVASVAVVTETVARLCFFFFSIVFFGIPFQTASPKNRPTQRHDFIRRPRANWYIFCEFWTSRAIIQIQFPMFLPPHCRSHGIQVELWNARQMPFKTSGKGSNKASNLADQM